VLDRIAALLIDVVVTFFVLLLLVRFHFQWLRVPFRNPIGEFVVALTNWIVRPARRVIPGIAGLDLATLLAAWIVQMLGLWLLLLVAGAPVGFGALAAVAAVDLVRYSLQILLVAVIVQALLSWINPYTPLAPVLDVMTRPFLRPLRRWVPPISNFDLTPAILILILLIALIPIVELREAARSV
jgi:YggT family protein